MGQVTTPEQLFVHELQDMYYAEKTLTSTLPKLASEARDKELQRAFKTHLEETKEQVENLEKVFEILGESAQGHPCPGMDGIKAEHDEFVKENSPQGDVLDVFLTGAAARAEHYEIAAYTGLVNQARALGKRDAVKLLQENLRQEKNALRTVEDISKRLVKNGTNGRSRARARSNR